MIDTEYIKTIIELPVYVGYWQTPDGICILIEKEPSRWRRFWMRYLLEIEYKSYNERQG